MSSDERLWMRNSLDYSCWNSVKVSIENERSGQSILNHLQAGLWNPRWFQPTKLTGHSGPPRCCGGINPVVRAPNLRHSRAFHNVASIGGHCPAGAWLPVHVSRNTNRPRYSFFHQPGRWRTSLSSAKWFHLRYHFFSKTCFACQPSMKMRLAWYAAVSGLHLSCSPLLPRHAIAPSWHCRASDNPQFRLTSNLSQPSHTIPY